MINHAYYKVPFYHDLFDSKGIKPQDINCVKDLQKLPILTKEIVRKNYPDKIVTKGLDITKCHNASTTGSTGMPLKISFDAKGHDRLIAFALFIWSEFGLRLKDKFVTIRHIGFKTDNNILFKKMRILNWENISIFNSVDDILNGLISSKPDVIYSYPSMLLILSQEIERKNITGIKPRLIFTSGETLTDWSRNKIKKVFNSNIYMWYGSEECGTIAFECKNHLGNHIINDTSIIEAVNEDKNVSEGEKGEIVVTCLFNYVMPLIRYKLGDIVTISNKRCACGRGFPLINLAEGRTDEFLTLPSGKKISPRVINVIEDIPGVYRYKTIQKRKNRIVVNLVKGKGFSKKTIVEVKRHIRSGCLGEDVEVEVKLVDELPLEGRGKLRAVISNVKE
jgi:phenylacetate-CoA ligase